MGKKHTYIGKPTLVRGALEGAVRILGAVMLVAGIYGCSNPPPSPEFVIKAGSESISRTAFADELDLKLTAYPYDIRSIPGEYNTMVLDLVSVLSDETVLLAAAKAKGIAVSDRELSQAEAEIKADYPEESFDQMLLENAISYKVWKKRLKKDMVIQKLVRQDLVNTQEITPEDMVGFYNRLGKGADKLSDDPGNLDEAGLVEQLRMEKSQAAYEGWIQGLKALYPLQIDKKVLAVFLINRE